MVSNERLLLSGTRSFSALALLTKTCPLAMYNALGKLLFLLLVFEFLLRSLLHREVSFFPSFLLLLFQRILFDDFHPFDSRLFDESFHVETVAADSCRPVNPLLAFRELKWPPLPMLLLSLLKPIRRSTP